MAKDHITTSQHLLKELEEHMRALHALDYHVAVLKETWTAIHVTFGNFKREIEVKEE